jgi:hypothetical protein
MTRNTQVLVTVIVGLLAPVGAGAVELGVDPARVYASELAAPVDLSADPGASVEVALGYNFSAGEIRYGRIECQGEGELVAANVVVTEADGNVAPGAVNPAIGGLFFSLTAGGALAVPTDTDMLTLDADLTLDGDGDVDCAFSIYDQPSQAQAGGANGRVYTTGFQPFVHRTSGFVFRTDTGFGNEAVADVENANGPYFGFDVGGNAFASLEFSVLGGVLKANGTQVRLLDIFAPEMSVTIDGDFSTLDELRAHNFVDSNIYIPDAQDEGTATYLALNFAADWYAQFRFEETGTDPIPVADYTATLHAVVNPGYAVDDIGPIAIGSISHNGTELQAPLAQVPGAGWLSRMVLTNSGSVSRPYVVSVMGERGNTIGTADTTGSLPANGTVVVDLDKLMTGFTEGQQRRGSINVTIAAPPSQIQGLYQIVNATSGSISNHVMVRPGTN